jgi:hypothetical protein
MGRCIIRVTHNRVPKYLEWSSVVDAPVTYGMTREEFKTYALAEYGRREGGGEDFDARLDRADKTGTSAIGWTLDDIISCNRAGPHETCATLDDIVRIYCWRKYREARSGGGS